MLAPVELVQHLLSFLDTATRPLLGASSAWVAIALLTVLVRVALLPLTIAQLRAARTPTRAAGAGGRAGGTCHPVGVAGGPHRQARRSGDARAADRAAGRDPGPGAALRGDPDGRLAAARRGRLPGRRQPVHGPPAGDRPGPLTRGRQPGAGSPGPGPWRRSNWLPASSSPQLLWPRTAWYDTRWPSPAARRPREHASLPWKAVA